MDISKYDQFYKVIVKPKIYIIFHSKVGVSNCFFFILTKATFICDKKENIKFKEHHLFEMHMS